MQYAPEQGRSPNGSERQSDALREVVKWQAVRESQDNTGTNASRFGLQDRWRQGAGHGKFY